MAGFVVMLMLLRKFPEAAGLIGGVGGVAGLLLIFVGPYRAEIPTVSKFVLSPPFFVGDDLSYEAHRWKGRGFVLHVSVPVTKLVPLRDSGDPTDIDFTEVKNTDLATSDLMPRKFQKCESSCVGLNPECVVRQRRVDKKSRLFIL